MGGYKFATAGDTGKFVITEVISSIILKQLVQSNRFYLFLIVKQLT